MRWRTCGCHAEIHRQSGTGRRHPSPLIRGRGRGGGRRLRQNLHHDPPHHHPHRPGHQSREDSGPDLHTQSRLRTAFARLRCRDTQPPDAVHAPPSSNRKSPPTTRSLQTIVRQYGLPRRLRPKHAAIERSRSAAAHLHRARQAYGPAHGLDHAATNSANSPPSPATCSPYPTPSQEP